MSYIGLGFGIGFGVGTGASGGDTDPVFRALFPQAEDTEWVEYERDDYDPEVDDEDDLLVFVSENLERIIVEPGVNVLVSETDEYIEVEVGTL